MQSRCLLTFCTGVFGYSLLSRCTVVPDCGITTSFIGQSYNKYVGVILRHEYISEADVYQRAEAMQIFEDYGRNSDDSLIKGKFFSNRDFKAIWLTRDIRDELKMLSNVITLQQDALVTLDHKFCKEELKSSARRYERLIEETQAVEEMVSILRSHLARSNTDFAISASQGLGHQASFDRFASEQD
ncbi:hypothetical protein PFICI_03147 [Pestalotiopsis fici W106-1]|uniref:Prion-inhibition and propagation HeLo domain-containing protein n=1 Tax=Pestalotiopsis fici (strain W106-1 / CGMCC3.15140) TaxID=1229662 RepID=W3XI51_PESFW|nr:uncharacterized protein PFICI_03147 [Pestalotiopsis fici W106-1]ETS85122.1 hypothetical protein PFICI_03147 [Pestalotiopsis fici W106-1]